MLLQKKKFAPFYLPWLKPLVFLCKSILHVAGIALLVVALYSFFGHAQTSMASCKPSFKYVSANEIVETCPPSYQSHQGSISFIHVGNDAHTYSAPAGNGANGDDSTQNSCPSSTIVVPDLTQLQNATVTYEVSVLPLPGPNSCQVGGTGPITIGSPENAKQPSSGNTGTGGTPFSGAQFNWVDNSTIAVTGSVTGTIKQVDEYNYAMTTQVNGICYNIVLGEDANGNLLPATGKLTALDKDGIKNTNQCKGGDDTNFDNSKAIGVVVIGHPENGPNGIPACNGNTSQKEKGCPGFKKRTFTHACGVEGAHLSIILCPIVWAMAGSGSLLDKYINNMLTVPVDRVFNVPGNGYYTAWHTFRILAYAILVIVGLIMVGAQAAGLEILDAYTIRKVLPRLLIAVIAISLSWPILKFLIQLTNDVGTATRSIIYSPFQGLPGGVYGLSVGTSAIAGIGGLVGVLFLNIEGLFLLMSSALLSLFIGFLVLVLRQITVTLLLVMAPIAIVCAILPNTQKAFSFWWSGFSKSLLMFPIITGMIAAGRVFATVANTESKSGAPGLGNVYEVVAVIAYILPYFLLPLTVKFAGGVIGTIGGFIDQQHKGAQGFLKRKRGEALQKNARNFLDNKYSKNAKYTPDGKPMNLRARFTDLGGYVGAMKDAKFSLKRKDYIENVKQSASGKRMARAQQALQENMALAHIENDDYYEAARLYTRNEDISKYLQDLGYSKEAGDQGAAAVTNARKSVGEKDFQLAIALALPGTATAFKPGQGQMNKAIMQAAGSDRILAANMMRQMRQSGADAGRLELSGGTLEESLRMLNEQYDGKVSADEVDAFSITRAQQTFSARDFAKAHPQTIKNMAGAMHRELEARIAESNADPGNKEKFRKVKQELAHISARQEMLSRGTPENAKEMADALLSLKVSSFGGAKGVKSMSVNNAIEAMRPDIEFQEVKREYGNQFAREIAAAGAEQQAQQAQAAAEQAAGGGPG